MAAKLFDRRAKGGYNIPMISTSEITIAVILEDDRIAAAAKDVHAGFGLNG